MESAVIYARFSSYGQNEQSIEAQVNICTEFAQGKDLKIVNVYTDKARTGTNDARPAFQRMISDAASGNFKYVIVYMFDRFARNRRDSIVYKEMLKDKYGIRVISALEPIADDEGGEFYEMFLEWNAEKYSKRLSKRVKDGLDISCANGTYCGGTLIYGYKIELEDIPGKPGKYIKRVAIDEEAAAPIRLAFELYNKGYRKREVLAEINSHGWKYKGRPFEMHQIDNWLINPKYTGEFVFGGRLNTNMYPPIISKETFEETQRRLKLNWHGKQGKDKKTPYLLTGKLFCGKCGSPMTADGGTSKDGIRHTYYTCNGRRAKICDKNREPKDYLEETVTGAVIDMLKDKENLEYILETVINYYNKRTDIKNIKSIETQMANIRIEIDNMANAFINAKSKMLRDSIEKKMAEREQLYIDLETQHDMLELERGYEVKKETIFAFVQDLIDGDIYDKQFQRKIIENLVAKVYIYDDDLILFLNIKCNSQMQEIPFEDLQLDKAVCVPKDSPLARQLKLYLNMRVQIEFFFCLNTVDNCDRIKSIKYSERSEWVWRGRGMRW